jgi:8-oxo-dGTP pyrophosphatase MutT (NUDIX family)
VFSIVQQASPKTDVAQTDERQGLKMASDYLQRLRHKVGHDLLLLPSVTIVALDESKRVLLVRHVNHGLWVAPGGMIEPDETPVMAAHREMQEETGCGVDLIRILGVYGGPGFRVRYENGDEVAYVMTVFQARIREGIPHPNGTESLEVRFFSAAEIERIRAVAWLPVVLHDAFR